MGNGRVYGRKEVAYKQSINPFSLWVEVSVKGSVSFCAGASLLCFCIAPLAVQMRRVNRSGAKQPSAISSAPQHFLSTAVSATVLQLLLYSSRYDTACILHMAPTEKNIGLSKGEFESCAQTCLDYNSFPSFTFPFAWSAFFFFFASSMLP